VGGEGLELLGGVEGYGGSDQLARDVYQKITLKIEATMSQAADVRSPTCPLLK